VDEGQMKDRTKGFAKEIIKLCRKPLFWLELIEEMKILDRSLIESLMQESDEIIAIIVSSIKTARKKK